MKYKRLSQIEAHDLLNSLRGRPKFEKAFQAEIDRRDSRQPLWALPKDDPNPSNSRSYYVVSLDTGEPYLLVAINGHLNVSSIFRISTNQIKCMAVRCFKYLFEKELIPSCKNSNRLCIYAHATTEDGAAFFTKLKRDLPYGVKTITGTERIKIEVNLNLVSP